MRHIATLLAITLLSPWAAAQQDPRQEPPTEEEIRRYTVEVILFSYEEDVAVGTEIFLPDKPAGAAEELLIDVDGPDRRPSQLTRADDAATAHKLEFVMLTKDELTLGKVARQFALLDVYETIMHFGWTQPTLPLDETRPIELRALGNPPAGLDGSFTLYLSRYLHLVVDLALEAPEGTAPTLAGNQPVRSNDPGYTFGDSRSSYGRDFGQRAQPVRFQIQEDRIVKNGDLRYFDHPKFGVLAKITRVEEEENDGEDQELFNPLLSGTP